MLYYMNVPNVDDNHILSRQPMVVDTDTFLAEACTEGKTSCESALHDFIISMTSPFFSEDFAFAYEGFKHMLYIWFKGYFFEIETSYGSLFVNDGAFGFLFKEDGSFISEKYNFIGRLGEDCMKLYMIDRILVDIHEGYAQCYNIEEGSEFRASGIKMYKESFLGKLVLC